MLGGGLVGGMVGGKEIQEGGNTCMRMADSLLYAAETNTTL